MNQPIVGAPLINFSECTKFLLPCFTLNLRLHRSSRDLSLQFLADSDDKIVVVFERASVFVTKWILEECVRLSLEKAFINGPVHYLYIGIRNKSFIIQAGKTFCLTKRFWKRSRETTKTMHGNQLTTPWNKETDVLNYQKFGLQRLEITRKEAVPIPGTTLYLLNGKMRAYYNTICSLGLSGGCGGKGSAFKIFEDYFVLLVDQTATRGVPKSLTLFAKLSGASFTLKILYEKALEKIVGVFTIGGIFSHFRINSQQNITKKCSFEDYANLSISNGQLETAKVGPTVQSSHWLLLWSLECR